MNESIVVTNRSRGEASILYFPFRIPKPQCFYLRKTSMTMTKYGLFSRAVTGYVVVGRKGFKLVVSLLPTFS